MTQEEKAKAYDEALNTIKKTYHNFKGDAKIVIDKAFPELSENEDERMIRSLKRLVKAYYDVNFPTPEGFKREDMIVWLEKQGEQKPNDKVEPKFKVGDWVVIQESTYQITKSENLNVTLSLNGRECIFDIDVLKNAHLWTIQDAKKGDILTSDKIVLIVDHIGDFEGENIIYSWYFTDSNKFYGMGPKYPDKWSIEGFHPAPKEQRDFLFQKMKEAGYEWDAEKKELKKIEQKPTDKDDALMSLDEAIEHCKERSCGNNACSLEHKQLEKWLTELKELKEQKPVEWSEEDIRNIQDIDSILFYDRRLLEDTRKRLRDFLASLKERMKVE